MDETTPDISAWKATGCETGDDAEIIGTSFQSSPKVWIAG